MHVYTEVNVNCVGVRTLLSATVYSYAVHAIRTHVNSKGNESNSTWEGYGNWRVALKLDPRKFGSGVTVDSIPREFYPGDKIR